MENDPRRTDVFTRMALSSDGKIWAGLAALAVVLTVLASVL